MDIVKEYRLNKKRDDVFDILKGIGIILMVLGHCLGLCGARSFIYLFHMAIFFICSGVFFKEKQYESASSLIKFSAGKIQRLYFPFALFNIFLILIHNFLLNINVYISNPELVSPEDNNNYLFYEYYSPSKIFKLIISTLLMGHGEQLAGATWFLRVLFWISIASCFGHYIARKFIKNDKYFNVVRFVIYSAALIIGFICQRADFNFYTIGAMLSCAFLYYLGILYQKYKERININVMSFICSLFVLLISYYYTANTVNLSANKYSNPVWLIISSVSGFIFILSISKFISKTGILKSILSYIGRHTISILLFHLITFKIITYIQLLILNKPDYMLASFTILEWKNGWWLLYLIAGVLIPLLISFVYGKLKSLIRSKE